MAQSYVTTNGTLIIPSAVASIQVQAGSAGLATTGVLLIVGEADAGPDFTIEVAGAGLQNNSFGAGQAAQVAAKYGSGPIVDAFRAAAQPANDPNIQGAPQAMIIAKTNKSTKAQSNLLNFAGGTYGALADKSYGAGGNVISFDVVAAAAEVKPTVTFTALIPIGAMDYSIRVNGGAATTGTGTLSATSLPSTFVTNLNGNANVTASGGVNRAILGGVAGNLAVAIVSGNAVTITYTLTWGLTPSVGDTFYIPTGSAIVGAGSANIGSYVVTAATANVISATKLMNATGGIGSLTAPVAVGSTPVAATTDAQAFSPITVTNTSNASVVIDGVGKDLVIAELTSSADRLSNLCYNLNTTKSTFVSKTGAPVLVTSATEQKQQLDDANLLVNVSESQAVGGEIALQISYAGTTATFAWDGTNFTGTVVGGSGASFVLAASQYSTIGTLAAKITSLTGWQAIATTGILGQLPVTALDRGTFNCANTFGEYTGRVKIDAYRWYNAIINNSALVDFGSSTLGVFTSGRAAAGLPAVTASSFLGALVAGARGPTLSTDVVAALAALELVQGNFVVTLFSRDASVDITAGITDPASTYTIAATNTAVRTHCLKMAQLKRKRNRQGFCSIKDTFVNAQAAAANIASFRVSMCFQDVKNLASSGLIVQFQPWMGAVVAAGMQAAGFYRGIVQKYANISGELQAAGDFNDQDDDAMETALIAGLLPLRRDTNGGFYWVSDQTTYGKDNNFVFNSIQATYVADIIALTTAQRMQRAFVGQSVADITASLALAFIEGVMKSLMDLKLIAASTDAPRGFKNVNVQIAGVALIVSLEVKLAGLIYFVPISFLISQVQQSASASV